MGAATGEIHLCRVQCRLHLLQQPSWCSVALSPPWQSGDRWCVQHNALLYIAPACTITSGFSPSTHGVLPSLHIGFRELSDSEYLLWVETEEMRAAGECGQHKCSHPVLIITCGLEGGGGTLHAQAQ
jgi:hypothetical protein